MITSLYPVPIRAVVQKTINVIPNIVFSLYPMPIRPIPPRPSIPNMVSSLYPMPVRFCSPPQLNFPPPPNINNLVPINDGKEGFSAQYSNMYYVMYSSLPGPSDIIGNSSVNTVHWNPAENNTDPPSHMILAIKNPIYDCAFFPVFDTFNNTFSMAWIENNIIGRLNLKYIEYVPNANTTTPPVSAVTNGPQTIFVRPNKTSIRENSKTQNIPLSDIYVTDPLGNAFDLNVFHQNNLPFGWEMILVNGVKSVKFIQSFKRAGGTLKCLMGTAPEAGTATTSPIPSIPLANVQVNVYYANTNLLLGTFYSDVNGKFEVPLKYGDFMFEIIVNHPSIYFTQIFV